MVEVVAKPRGHPRASKFKHLSHVCGTLTVLATCLLPLMVSWLPTFRHRPSSSLEPATIIEGDIVLVECLIATPNAPFVNTENNEKEAGAEGIIQIQVRQDLSPIASKVFLDLVTAKYYDGVFIFRVLEGFVAQWGHHHHLDSDDTKHDPWPDTTKPPKDKDAFVKGKTLSNKRGTLSFAGGNPDVQQVFVNLGDNARLDVSRSYPFATLTEKSMTQVMDKLYMGYKDGEGQIKALEKGEKAVLEQFPRMSMVEQCRVLSLFSPTR